MYLCSQNISQSRLDYPLFMEPLPTTNRIFSMVIQYEWQQGSAQATPEEQNNFVTANMDTHLGTLATPEDHDSTIVFLVLERWTSLPQMEK